MKNVALIVLVFWAQFSPAMDEIAHKNVLLEGPCLISRVQIKIDAFSWCQFYLNNFRPWPAFAIDSFHRLTCSNEGDILKSSPIKRIQKGVGEYLVHTFSNSIYRVPDKSLMQADTFCDVQKIFTVWYQGQTDKMPVYIKRDLATIKAEMERGDILVGQSYKEWRPVRCEEDLNVFDNAARLAGLKEGEEIVFDLSWLCVAS